MSVREFSQMKLRDLQKVQDDLTEAIKLRKAAEASEVRKELVDIVKRKGFTSLDEIFGKKLSPKGGYKQQMAPKYRDPNDPKKTWSGHGRKSNWLIDRLNKGAKLDDFRV